MTAATDPAEANDLGPALAHLRGADPVLARVIDAHPGFDPRAWLRELPAMDPFGALIFMVTGQQLSVRSAGRILGRIQDLFGGRLPSPAELLAADPGDLLTTGLSRRKVATLRAVAAQFAAGSLSDGALRRMSDQEILDRLTAIPGIGPWTVHGFLIVALDRADVVLPGDLALRKSIQRSYRLDHLPSQDEVLRIAEPWRPYRSMATAYLFQVALSGPALARQAQSQAGALRADHGQPCAPPARNIACSAAAPSGSDRTSRTSSPPSRRTCQRAQEQQALSAVASARSSRSTAGSSRNRISSPSPVSARPSPAAWPSRSQRRAWAAAPVTPRSQAMTGASSSPPVRPVVMATSDRGFLRVACQLKLTSSQGRAR